MIRSDTEKILIGTWLADMHREDMANFEPGMFPHYSILFANLRNGVTDYLDLMRAAGLKPQEMSDLLTSSAEPEFYRSVLRDVQTSLADDWLAEHPNAKPWEISKAMERYTVKESKLPTPTKDPVDALIEELDRRAEEEVVTTGLNALDSMLCGVRRKELTAVGARPSVGKSAFVQQIAMRVAEQGKKVLFFPLEMSESSVMQRMLLKNVTIPQSEIRNGLSKESWENANEAFDKMHHFMEQGNFLIFERCNDIQVIRQLVEQHDPYMIVIDQLEQLKDGDKRWDGKRDRFSYMTHEMQAMSLDMNIAVWFACQINRSADNTAPTMANLKESGTIEEDSTNVILLHRDGDKAVFQDIQVELAKQKDGECGTIMTRFHAPTFTFFGTERRL